MLVRVVEDHPDIAELLRLELAHAGVDVDVWTSRFEELLDVDIWEEVDAAIFDLMLGSPAVTGGDLVVFVAANAPHIRRIILTATPEAHLTRELRDAAHVVLDKPTGIGTLMKAIRGAG